MHTRADKKQENKPVAGDLPAQRSGKKGLRLTDNRPEAVAQKNLAQMINSNPRTSQLKTSVAVRAKVAPTVQLKQGVPVNDNAGLEKEADVMGSKALQGASKEPKTNTPEASITQSIYAWPAPPVAQLIVDRKAFYWRRLEDKAGDTPAAFVTRSRYLVHYISDPANRDFVGANVANQVIADFPLGVNPAGIGAVQTSVNTGLDVDLVVAGGHYAADTAHNADLTGVLRANAFIQSVITGALHNTLPKWRGRRMAPAAADALPVPTGRARNDDRILETTDLFNRLTNIPNALPAVNVRHIPGPHAAMGQDGDMILGWAAARGNILHEFGHHLENNLGPADFITLHNFLTARSRMPAPAPGVVPGPMAGMRDSGYFFEHHPGYNIEMPEINAGGVAGRPAPQTRWERFKHGAASIKQSISRAYHARPAARYTGLFVTALRQQIGKLLSFVSRRREPRNWGAKGVENFFVINANNQQLSYSTAVHNFGHPNPRWYTGSTEYLSTTTEFFNRPSHARELVNVDPLRVALFLYLANRPQYNLVRAAFAALPAPAPPAPARPDLNDLIHAVR